MLVTDAIASGLSSRRYRFPRFERARFRLAPLPLSVPERPDNRYNRWIFTAHCYRATERCSVTQQNPINRFYVLAPPRAFPSLSSSLGDSPNRIRRSRGSLRQREIAIIFDTSLTPPRRRSEPLPSKVFQHRSGYSGCVHEFYSFYLKFFFFCNSIRVRRFKFLSIYYRFPILAKILYGRPL